MYYVSAMIHLTPSGSWQDRTAVANTERIRISSGSSLSPLTSLRKVKVRQGTSASEEMRRKVQNREDRFQRIHETPLPFRIFLFALLSSMGLLTMSSSRKRIPEKTKKWGRYLWIGFGIILFAASFAELFELQKHAISLGRGIARYIGLYWSRRSFQAWLSFVSLPP